MVSKSAVDAKAQAEATFKKKENRVRESAKAVAEYEALNRAVSEKTARLKALRLAKEAADAEGGASGIGALLTGQVDSENQERP